MESLGNYLKRERELREITLSEIAKETRVRQDLLEAIEEEEFDSLPAPAFVKGFLRAYSKYVGLDSNDVILRYEDLLERREEGKT
ncbi:MAG: helix-turn-helix domain-containing protein, partial [Thermodesulfobacteriota bacterium]